MTISTPTASFTMSVFSLIGHCFFKCWPMAPGTINNTIIDRGATDRRVNEWIKNCHSLSTHKQNCVFLHLQRFPARNPGSKTSPPSQIVRCRTQTNDQILSDPKTISVRMLASQATSQIRFSHVIVICCPTASIPIVPMPAAHRFSPWFYDLAGHTTDPPTKRRKMRNERKSTLHEHKCVCRRS